MRLILSLLVGVLAVGSTAFAEEKPAQKEWTFLVFINGNNNLDTFGAYNINQMEEVGSTSDLNVVVQWASYSTRTTKRLYVTKDNDPKKVTSQVVQNLGKVDMGDYHQVTEFVKWAHQNYPAKKYMLSIWNHGSGWHERGMRFDREGGHFFSPQDISFDDFTGNKITTAQMGVMMKDIAAVIGHKLDLYGSDACLMAMVEVAAEVADSVEVFAGSQELEPGEGWPYNTFLKAWAANPKASAQQVGTTLAKEYKKSYMGGVNGTSEVTFSVFNLDALPEVQSVIKSLGGALKGLSPAAKQSFTQASSSAQSFTYFSDYVDFGDLLAKVESTRLISGIPAQIIADGRAALGKFVIANEVTQEYDAATGMSIWVPDDHSTLTTHTSLYKPLKFNQATGWLDALTAVYTP